MDFALTSVQQALIDRAAEIARESLFDAPALYTGQSSCVESRRRIR
jgi:hypothetical protein